MKKVTKPLSPEAFEAVCSIWEQHINEFIFQLSDGSIPTLRNAEWSVRKKRVFVCEPDPNGKKKRGACGPYYSSFTSLNRAAAGAVWKLFKRFSKEHGLNSLERLRNNEKELGRYDFRASNSETEDEFSCSIFAGRMEQSGDTHIHDHRPALQERRFMKPAVSMDVLGAAVLLKMAYSAAKTFKYNR